VINPDIIKLLEYAGTAGGVIGQLYVAHQRTAGFWWWIVANLALITVAIVHGLYGMAALYGYFTVMAGYSIWKWQTATANKVCEQCLAQNVDKK